MPYKPSQIANYFITKALEEGQGITPMKAIKLTYIAHGWYLALANQPLINEAVQAWKFGPVVHSLYTALKKYGNEPIQEPIKTLHFDNGRLQRKTEKIPEEDRALLGFLHKIWDIYGKYTALQLSSMTHAKNTPWSKTVQPYICKGYIPLCLSVPDEVIRQHFAEKAEIDESC